MPLTRARNGLKKPYAAARLFLPCRVRFPLCVSAVVARKEIAPCFAGLSLYLKNRQARPLPAGASMSAPVSLFQNPIKMDSHARRSCPPLPSWSLISGRTCLQISGAMPGTSPELSAAALSASRGTPEASPIGSGRGLPWSLINNGRR